MTKNSFLSQLNFCLMFKLNAQQRQNVLQDYKDFFDDGLTNGESEDTLCKKFGSPAEIARELSNGEVNNNLVFSATTLILLLFMVLFLFSNQVFYLTQISYRYVLALTSIFATVVCARGMTTLTKKPQKLVSVFFGIALITFAAWFILIYNLFSIDIRYAGNIAGASYNLCSIIVVISLYILIINRQYISKKFIILLPCLFYIILSMCEMYTMLGDVSAISEFVPLQSLMISALFIAPSFALSLFFAFRKGRV